MKITQTISKWLKRKFILPLRKWIARFFHFLGDLFYCPENINKDEESLSDKPGEKWKKSALNDFKAWLDDIYLPKDDAKLDITPDTCDLYTLLCEFTALRQEIRMQNRQQHKTLKTLDSVQSVTDEYKEALYMFKQRSKEISQLETNMRLNAEKNVAAYFFDLRDSLIRGHKATLEIISKKKFFRPYPKGMETTCQGYEKAIQRFDQILANMEIYPVKTDNAQFDPETMSAVETKKISKMEKGIVLENISSGFIHDNSVLRFAKVIVSA